MLSHLPLASPSPLFLKLHSLPQRDILDICPSSLTMAQQLTLIEMERLRHISPEEFVQAFANETSKLSAACRHAQSPVCVEAYTHWFNRLSYFIATEIIMVSSVGEKLNTYLN